MTSLKRTNAARGELGRAVRDFRAGLRDDAYLVKARQRYYFIKMLDAIITTELSDSQRVYLRAQLRNPDPVSAAARAAAVAALHLTLLENLSELSDEHIEQLVDELS